jgi:hypothetical protein
MSNLTFRSSPPDTWILPRPHRDPSLRLMTYGPLVPMDPPSFWQRLLGAR